MAKIKTQYKCKNCGNISSKLMGKCSYCNEWNTYEEEIIQPNETITKNTSLSYNPSEAIRLPSISNEDIERMATGFAECDRVLGGGIVLGSLILLSGDAGIGKSTLLLSIIGNISNLGDVLYVSGEESKTQVKIRANRLGIQSNNVIIMSETNISYIIDKINEIKPKLVIIDSIQTMYDASISSTAGNTSQIKQCTLLLMNLANATSIPIIIVGHVTKDGDIAGPKHLEHMVDVVLYFEGDKQQQIRILRTEKNRFGATNEVGVFEMKDEGLVEVRNPSELFMSEDTHLRSGSAIVVSMEGTRPILAEVQALVVPTTFNYPRRMSVGIDYNRIVLLSAVLEKRLNVPLSRFDIYINVVGGLKLPETSSDLAVAFAIVSSLKDIPMPERTIVLGELGLTGEMRNIPQLYSRLNEAKKLGWNNVIIPNVQCENIPNLNIMKVKTLQEAFNKVWN